jgi:hypothetical protein
MAFSIRMSGCRRESKDPASARSRRGFGFSLAIGMLQAMHPPGGMTVNLWMLRRIDQGEQVEAADGCRFSPPDLILIGSVFIFSTSSQVRGAIAKEHPAAPRCY